jgi:GntR family transcriptional regulator
MTDPGEDLGFKPLYARVRDILRGRIASGAWSPGTMLPSENDIARELGVSQGTVRKALDDMTAERLLVRRQGRGTFVARHDEARILFQFFKLSPDDGAPVFPESRVLSALRTQATPDEAKRLGHAGPIVRIRRVRSLGGRPCIVETITLPDIPNNLYDLYARRYGVTVSGGLERVKAVGFTAEDAALIGLQAGAPALLIDRLAHGLDDRPVEWRVSLCDSTAMHYASELR